MKTLQHQKVISFNLFFQTSNEEKERHRKSEKDLRRSTWCLSVVIAIIQFSRHNGCDIDA